MRVKYVIDEDFVNYYKPSMFIGTVSCGGKCCHEVGIPLTACQNDGWRERAPVVIDDRDLCGRYLTNHLTSAIVFGGLEPFEQRREIIKFIYTLRETCRCTDDVVIYTGYRKDEIVATIGCLRRFPNIIVKYGRYIPNSKHRYDEVLGIELSSDNQYAERIS